MISLKIKKKKSTFSLMNANGNFNLNKLFCQHSKGIRTVWIASCSILQLLEKHNFKREVG